MYLTFIEKASNFEHLNKMDMNATNIDVKSVFMNHKSALLFSAAKSGDDNLAHFLLDQCRADPNTCEINNSTPLFEASKNGHIEVVRLLIKYGANLNKESKTEVDDEYYLLSENGESSVCWVTPLHIAIIWKQLETAKILIENGANVNVEVGYRSGFTPLFLNF